MNDDVEELALLLGPLSPAIQVAMACAAAERVLPIYEAVGSGEPGVLAETLASLWQWAESGAPPSAAEQHSATLESYAAAHYDEGDDVLGHVVSAVLEALAVYRARDEAEERGLAVGRALALNADLSDEVDAVLAEEVGFGRADTEEGAWRSDAIERAKHPRPSLRETFPRSHPGWMEAFLEAQS